MDFRNSKVQLTAAVSSVADHDRLDGGAFAEVDSPPRPSLVLSAGAAAIEETIVSVAVHCVTRLVEAVCFVIVIGGLPNRVVQGKIRT